MSGRADPEGQRPIERDLGGLEQEVNRLRLEADRLREEVKTAAEAGLGALLVFKSATPSSTTPGYGQSARRGDFFPGSCQPSATRYRGFSLAPPGDGAGTSASTAWLWDWPGFATVSNLALWLDRPLCRRGRAHVRLQLNGEGHDAIPALARGFPRIGGSASAPIDFGRGRGDGFRSAGGLGRQDVMVDEVHASFDLDDDWTVKVGAFALPFSIEHVGPGRTTRHTVTPSAIGTHWEHMRPRGIELTRRARGGRTRLELGLVTALNGDGPFFALGGARAGGVGGTLLSGFQVIDGGTVVDAYGRTSGAPHGRLPTGRLHVMTDAPVGIHVSDGRGNPIDGFVRVSGEWSNPVERWGWSLGLASSGGDVRPSSAREASLSDWWAAQATLRMQNNDDQVKGAAYHARSANATVDEVVGKTHLPLTPMPNARRDDTVTWAMMGLVEHRFTAKTFGSMLFEWVQEDTGLARLSSQDWRFSWGIRWSRHERLAVEYFTRDNVKGRSDTGFLNLLEPDDDQVLVDYKVSF